MSALTPSAPVERSRLSYASRMAQLKPSAIREILKTTVAPDVISFAGGLPAPELFPTDALRAAAEAVLSTEGPASLQYGVTEGHAPLRRWIAEHVGETVKLDLPPERVLVTHGSQQALDLISKVLLNPGDTVVVENPAYLGALQAFQSYEANIVGVAADAEGIRPNLLEAALQARESRVKFLYLIPNYQNPTGTSWSAERRHEVARLAASRGVLVVEDDPYGRLRFSGEALPALGASAGNADWVYLGSTSKILAPGLRVGWLCTSCDSLYERLVTAKQACDLHTSSLTQRIVAHAVAQPDWLDRHVQTLIEVYRKRRDLMLTALQQEFAGVATWTRPEGGLFLWMSLVDKIDTLELLRRAAAHKVAFVPGAPFWVGHAPVNTLRLNFSNATEAGIVEGIARLARLVR